MSHITVGKANIASVDAAKLAATKLGLEVLDKKKYRTYYGESAAEQGKEIVCVFSVPERLYEKHGIKVRGYNSRPYELALMRDTENKEKMSLVYDSHGGGYGLEKIIGTELVEEGKEPVLAPIFLMYYQMSITELTAAETGDEVEFQPLEDGSWQSITRPKEERLQITF